MSREPEAEAPGASVDIQLNGESARVEKGASLLQLVQSLDLHPRAVAVERNGVIVKREDYGRVVLEAGDRVELVRFVQGGLRCSSAP